MSLRLEMLQVARLAPTVLGEDATARILQFLLSQETPSGGFADRDGNPDLYYTSFAVDALTALQSPLPASLPEYLKGADVESLDFVHLCCLVRVWSAIEGAIDEGQVSNALTRIEGFRTPDGGYNQSSGANGGSAYACLLAYGAYADHSRTPPDPSGVVSCVESLSDEGGSYVNDRDFPVGNAPSTAAAVTLARSLRFPTSPDAGRFLLSCFHPPSGGFLPFPGAPLPDLLSTAVSLHALDGLQVSYADQKEASLDFVDSLWNADGGFHGNWGDDILDIEYTYYGLLALGHLSL